VIAVDVEPGVTVVKGQRLLAMEAMKLEHAVMADTDGVLSEIVGLGAQVALGHVVARITPITND
jgi:biotin carboxyl carrier protein